MRVKLALFVVFSALGLDLVGAPDLAPKGRAGEDGLQVSAVWLDGAAAKNADLFINQPKDPIKIIPGNNHRSALVTVKEPGSSIIFVSRPKSVGGGVQGAPVSAPKSGGGSIAPVEYYPAGEISWPKTGRTHRILLLLAAAPGGAGSGPQIRGVALADDVESFPAHTIRVANFTPQPIFLRIGNKVENIPVGLSRPFAYARFAQPDEKGIPLFPLALARVSKDGGSDIFFSTNGEGRPGSRLQLIVSPVSDASKPPVVSRLLDTVPAEAPAVPKPVR